MSENIAFQYHGIFVIFSKRVVFKHVVIFLTLNKKQKSAENKLIIFSGLEFSFCCFVVHILFLFFVIFGFFVLFSRNFWNFGPFPVSGAKLFGQNWKSFYFILFLFSLIFWLLSFALLLSNCGNHIGLYLIGQHSLLV